MSEHTLSQPLTDSRAASRSNLLTGRNLWLVTVLGLLAFVLLLWLPFSFKTPGLMEEWMIIHDWEVGGKSDQNQDVGLFVTTGTLAMRPLDPLPFIIAHEVVPDSFLGFNIYLISTFVLKGLLLYAILRRLLPENPLFALGVALLFIIFPADDGLFTFRGMNIHTAVCLYLFATYLLLSYYEKPRAIKLIGIWIALIVSLFAYESGHPLIAVTPALLLWKERRFSRKLVRTAVLWWVAPLIAFVYAVFMFVRPDTYQSWLLGHSGLNQSSVLGEIAQSFVMTYRRHFGDGWIPALKPETFAPLLPYALAIGATSIAVFTAHLPWARQLGNPARRRYVELFFIGLLIIFLGYVIYMITPYRQLTWRVYYFSGIGGAICIACLVYLVARLFKRWRAIFTVAMCSLIAVAGVHALDQHQYYVGLADMQQQLLRGVMRAVPELEAPATLVVVDETGRYMNNWTLGTSYLVENALRYLYDDYSMKAMLCSYNPQAASFNVLPELQEQCAFAADGLRLSQSNAVVKTVPYGEMAVVRFTDAGAALLPSLPVEYVGAADDAASAYDAAAHVDTSAPLPYRYHTAFSLPE